MRINLTGIQEYLKVLPADQRPAIEITQEEIKRFISLHGAFTTISAVAPDYRIGEECDNPLEIDFMLAGELTSVHPVLLGNIIFIEYLYHDTDDGSLVFTLTKDEDGVWRLSPHILELHKDLAGAIFSLATLMKLIVLTLEPST